MAAEKLEKLNDCPFCGAHFIEIRYNEVRRRYYGCCITCMSKSTECADYGIAVSKWNRRPDTNETGATFHQQPQAETCPCCSIDGTLYNSLTGKWDIVCDMCGGTGKLSAGGKRGRHNAVSNM